MNAFSKILVGVAGRIKTARLNQALSRLSDRQLADIGLSRDNVSRRALELAQQR